MSLLPDQPDARVWSRASGSANLPSSADLRVFAGNIEDQMTTNSCTANAGVSALELFTKRAGASLNFSRLFLYYNERQNTKFAGKDSGATVENLFKSMQQDGVCLEVEWPFDTSKINTQPTASCYESAKKYKIGKYSKIKNIETIKLALAQGYPIVFSNYLFKGFQELRGDLSTQLEFFRNYPIGSDLGSHTMLLVGYNDVDKYFIVENSWGISWGDNGYCYIPYDIFQAVSYDMYVFTEFSDFNPPILFDPKLQDLSVKISGKQAFNQGESSEWRIDITGGFPPYNIRAYSTTGGCSISEGDTEYPIISFNSEDTIITEITDSDIIPNKLILERKITKAISNSSKDKESNSSKYTILIGIAIIACIVLFNL